jgi:PAS domain S-box-containing protein
LSNPTRHRRLPTIARFAAWRACLVIGVSALFTPLLLADQPAVTGRVPILTHAAQLRQLSPQEVEKAYPVRLRGVVTYYDSVAPNLFVQDSTAGIWVDVAGAANPPKPGQLIDLEGVVGAGFTPIVTKVHWTVLGTRAMPRPQAVVFSELATGAYDSQWVQIEGIVRSFTLEAAGSVLVIDVSTAGGVIKVRIPDYHAPFPMELIDANVRFRGVCGTAFNRQHQLVSVHLFVPGVGNLVVVDPALSDPFSMPTSPIGSLATFAAKGINVHRVKLKGIVTAQLPGRGLYVKDTTGGLYVQTEDGGVVEPGTEVEAVGFPALGQYTPVLRSARFRPTGQHQTLTPLRITPKEALFGNYDAQLVEIEGVLQADRPDNAGGHILVTESGNLVFHALIDQARIQTHWPSLLAGTKMRLTGICSVRTDENGNVSEFRIILRSPQDIAVLARPPWLTASRALSLLGLLVVVIVGALLWVRSLRRRVLHQTGVIRRQIESEAHLEQRYRSLIENSPYGIASLDKDCQLLDVNPAFRQIAGLSLSENISGLGLPLHEVLQFSPPDLSRFNSLLALGGTFQHAEFTCQKRNTAELILRVSGHVIPEQANISSRVEIILEDITSQRQLELQLFQNQKIEAVGRLAGGVAHDFNNLLMIISGHVSLLLHKFGRNSAEGEKLEIVEGAASRAAGLTRQLLAYSRKQVLEPKVLAIDPLVKNLEGMLRRLIREDIELRTELNGRDARVKVDPNQLEQVLINLAVNARDAMPDGGLLLIRTERSIVKPGHRLPSPMATGSYVLITVADSGAGMDSATQERLFEPFFTTKEMGKGTGLGLSMVYGIVRQSGGHIVVESAPGKGSRFQLYLPLVEQPVSVSGSRASELPPARGKGNILLVEDEKELRTLLAETLTGLGYTVLQAGDGEEAIELAKSALPAIDMLITDMVMPKMNGRELSKSLRARRPGLPVLFISGYSDVIPTEEEFFNVTTQFLQKPFNPESLGHRVRELLLFRTTSGALQKSASASSH